MLNTPGEPSHPGRNVTRVLVRLPRFRLWAVPTLDPGRFPPESPAGCPATFTPIARITTGSGFSDTPPAARRFFLFPTLRRRAESITGRVAVGTGPPAVRWTQGGGPRTSGSAGDPPINRPPTCRSRRRLPPPPTLLGRRLLANERITWYVRDGYGGLSRAQRDGCGGDAAEKTVRPGWKRCPPGARPAIQSDPNRPAHGRAAALVPLPQPVRPEPGFLAYAPGSPRAGAPIAAPFIRPGSGIPEAQPAVPWNRVVSARRPRGRTFWLAAVSLPRHAGGDGPG